MRNHLPYLPGDSLTSLFLDIYGDALVRADSNTWLSQIRDVDHQTERLILDAISVVTDTIERECSHAESR